MIRHQFTTLCRRIPTIQSAFKFGKRYTTISNVDREADEFAITSTEEQKELSQGPDVFNLTKDGIRLMEHYEEVRDLVEILIARDYTLHRRLTGLVLQKLISVSMYDDVRTFIAFLKSYQFVTTDTRCILLNTSYKNNRFLDCVHLLSSLPYMDSIKVPYREPYLAALILAGEKEKAYEFSLPFRNHIAQTRVYLNLIEYLAFSGRKGDALELVEKLKSPDTRLSNNAMEKILRFYAKCGMRNEIVETLKHRSLRHSAAARDIVHDYCISINRGRTYHNEDSRLIGIDFSDTLYDPELSDNFVYNGLIQKGTYLSPPPRMTGNNLNAEELLAAMKDLLPLTAEKDLLKVIRNRFYMFRGISLEKSCRLNGISREI